MVSGLMGNYKYPYMKGFLFLFCFFPCRHSSKRHSLDKWQAWPHRPFLSSVLPTENAVSISEHAHAVSVLLTLVPIVLLVVVGANVLTQVRTAG